MENEHAIFQGYSLDATVEMNCCQVYAQQQLVETSGGLHRHFNFVEILHTTASYNW